MTYNTYTYTNNYILPTTETKYAAMATEDTVQLNEAHAPKEASIDAFGSILESVKSELVKLRRDHDSRCLLSPYLLTMPIYRQNMIFTTNAAQNMRSNISAP